MKTEEKLRKKNKNEKFICYQNKRFNGKTMAFQRKKPKTKIIIIKLHKKKLIKIKTQEQNIIIPNFIKHLTSISK